MSTCSSDIDGGSVDSGEQGREEVEISDGRMEQAACLVDVCPEAVQVEARYRGGPDDVDALDDVLGGLPALFSSFFLD